VSAVAYVQAPNDDTDFDREAAKGDGGPIVKSAGTNDETFGAVLDDSSTDKPVLSEAQAREQRRALCCSILTLLMSIPALIGA